MKIEADVSFEWNIITKNRLENSADKILYTTARVFADMVTSSIPRNTGRMRREALSYGVRKIKDGYRISSPTSYAKYVYNFEEPINWTTPGTESQWYEKEWRKKGQLVQSVAVARNVIK